MSESAVETALATDEAEVRRALALLIEARNAFGGRPGVFIQALQSLAYTETKKIAEGLSETPR